ncbi:MAG TPA: hypothetical protein VGK33_00285 [Chloroflexota bacterium]
MSDPTLTLDAIDQRLAGWESQVARVQANLDLLEQTPTYAFISGGLKLTGRTEREIAEPILAAHELADQSEVLAGQVAKARLLRDSLKGFSNKLLSPNKESMREIDRLLNQPCVPLPATQVTLAQRNLLDDPTVHGQLSLAQLVDLMAPAFAAARDAVTRYDQVMAELTPQLKAAEQQLANLAQRAAALGQGAQAEVEQVRPQVVATRRLALDDPLGVQADLARQLETPLRGLDERLASAERDRSSLRDELARAQARQAHAARGLEADPSRVADLGEWLTGIARTVGSGEYAAARVGLQRWTAAADSLYGAEERRQEQLGLLKALRVMVQQRRARGEALDASLDALALEAESVLRQRPTDLARGCELVERYQRSLARPREVPSGAPGEKP